MSGDEPQVVYVLWTMLTYEPDLPAGVFGALAAAQAGAYRGPDVAWVEVRDGEWRYEYRLGEREYHDLIRAYPLI